MSRRTRTDARLRAIIGVIALYGFLLQGALVAMARFAAAADPGVAPICAPDHGGQPGQDDGAAHPHPCCLAACTATAAALAPDPAAHAVAWPPRAPLPSAPSRFALTYPTGPPVGATSPRGPPTTA